MSKKKMNYPLWSVQALLALLFLFTGSMKLILPVEEMTKQMPLPGAFLRFLGVAEVLGACGLILPVLLRIRQGLTPLAACGLGIIMIGATVLTLQTGDVAAALLPFVVGLLLLFVAYGRIVLSKPDSFRVERATTIQAPREEIFALIADFHKWVEWSPYEDLDPAMQKAFSGAPHGKGAVYEWAGNFKAGQGRMEILEVFRKSRILIQLDFLKPFECRSFAEFSLKADGPNGDFTRVTWAMYGRQSNLAKVMTTFFNRDNLVGKDFAKGLANLQAVVNQQRSVLCS
jgi:hypothetical protein